MAWVKAKTAVALGVAVLLATGTTTVVLKKSSSYEILPIHEEILRHPDQSNWENLKNAPPVLVIRPGHRWLGGIERGPGKKVWVGGSLPDLLSFAYHGTVPRMVLPVDLPPGKFDYLNTLGDGHDQALQEQIKKQFGLAVHRDIRNIDVLRLEVKDASRLVSHLNKDGNWANTGSHDRKSMKRILVGQPLSAVAQLAEDWCEMPTVDQTGVSGNYDFTFEWPNAMSPATAGRSAEIRHLFDDQLANELGLEMVPTNMPLEVLVVEKVK